MALGDTYAGAPEQEGPVVNEEPVLDHRAPAEGAMTISYVITDNVT